jgi:hypothetical protein
MIVVYSFLKLYESYSFFWMMNIFVKVFLSLFEGGFFLCFFFSILKDLFNGDLKLDKF